ncbi:hypothetical protein B566_EDAN015841 [Ephemera danica]|nr:hypothetical protein B566_EDAN015841 [Ephemera danica]
MMRNICAIFRVIESAERTYRNKLFHSIISPSDLLLKSCSLCGSANVERTFYTSLPRSKSEDRREMMASLPKIDEGTAGEKSIDVDTIFSRSESLFPDENTPNRLFNGIPFSQLPVCNIRVTHNNTIVSLADSKGKIKILRSCGIEGFKNTRKGTNIAAQATAISVGTRAVDQGFKTVRVRVRGLGPGRMSAIKGLQMGGLDVISITDNTRVSWNPPRPRKQRRI